jgi:hypothetical protein
MVPRTAITSQMFPGRVLRDTRRLLTLFIFRRLARGCFFKPYRLDQHGMSRIKLFRWDALFACGGDAVLQAVICVHFLSSQSPKTDSRICSFSQWMTRLKPWCDGFSPIAYSSRAGFHLAGCVSISCSTDKINLSHLQHKAI